MSRSGFFFAQNRLLGEFLLILTLLWIVQPQSIKNTGAPVAKDLLWSKHLPTPCYRKREEFAEEATVCVWHLPVYNQVNDAVLFDKECE